MTTYVYPSHDDPMGWIRLIWPALHLDRSKVKVMMPHIKDRILYDLDVNSGKVVPQIPTDATTMVVQRVTDRVFVEIIRKWRDAGLRVILDMDDDLRAITSGSNVNAFNLLHNSADKEVSWKNTEETAKLASLVTCSTPRLVERYGHGHGMLIRNAVPDAYLRVQTPVDRGTIGWSGSIGFRAYDPEEVGMSLCRLQREGYTIRTVGTDPVSVQKAFRLDELPDARSSVPLFQFEWTVAPFHVGIVPLKPSQFNMSKSWLKGLQLAALGVPFVASPAPDYVAMFEMGAGVLAQGQRDWYRQIKRLLMDDAYADDVRARGFDMAKTQTYGVRRNEWEYAWQV